MKTLKRHIINAARAIKHHCCLLPIYVRYVRAAGHRFGMDKGVYCNELKKWVQLYRTTWRRDYVYTQMKTFFGTAITLHSDTLNLSQDQLEPTLVVTVKDELERMKLIYEHYRKLGIKQFIIIDNGSTDGTMQFVEAQPGTRVYRVDEPFLTPKKEAWIARVLALTGYNRWYVVVDADELIDYVGSERHSVKELIESHHNNGHSRLQGYMVDMYAQADVFAADCAYSEIPEVFSYFDTGSYFEKSSNSIFGGPRHRVFGLNNYLSKQAIFCYLPDMLYHNCHSLHWPGHEHWIEMCFVLRHYKFLKTDLQFYQERVKKKNYYNDSEEYKAIFDTMEHGQAPSLYYKESTHYINSESLRSLPFIKWTDWK